MKNIALIFSILLMGFSANATSNESENNNRRGYDGNAYIFVEGDVEFSVFPDGQFDFVYVGPQKGSSVTINTPNVNISFNSGYDYDAYVQYDDYGAVIQVESVPIYYDYYGRIIQAGNVDIQYNDRRLVRVGGLHVVYNNYGYFSHCTGVINMYNPYYVYRPWHVYYARPIYSHCVVYDMPYRRYYSPVRYSYHDHVVYYKNRKNVAYHNGRRDFYRPGSRVYDKKGRSSINKEYNPNRRNTMVASNNSRNYSSVRSDKTQANNTRSNTVSRNSSTNSKGATNVDRNTHSTRNISGNVSRENTVTSRSGNTTRVNGNNTNRNVEKINPKNNVKNNRIANTTRPTNSRNVLADRNVQKQQTRTTSSNNKSRSVTKNTTQAPKRETASRSTVNKSSAPSRSSSKANTVSRGNSSSSKTIRGRG
ncbi:MAG: hypothetical protein KDC94_04635 [Aequorivita sp.]|nr:hypothetical protein [Aequorivita sp.]HPE82531.1 hypothetical protein [Aequorivita sp.]